VQLTPTAAGVAELAGVEARAALARAAAVAMEDDRQRAAAAATAGGGGGGRGGRGGRGRGGRGGAQAGPPAAGGGGAAAATSASISPSAAASFSTPLAQPPPPGPPPWTAEVLAAALTGAPPRYSVPVPSYAKVKKPGKRVSKHAAKPPVDGACLRAWTSRLQPRPAQRRLLRRLFTKAVDPLYNWLAKYVNDCRDKNKKVTDGKLESLAKDAAEADPEIGEMPATMRRSVVVQVEEACETSKRQEEKARYVHELWLQGGALRRPLSPSCFADMHCPRRRGQGAAHPDSVAADAA